MGEEGGGEALSLFRFHLSPFPQKRQKRLILRLTFSLPSSSSSSLLKVPNESTKQMVLFALLRRAMASAKISYKRASSLYSPVYAKDGCNVFCLTLIDREKSRNGPRLGKIPFSQMFSVYNKPQSWLIQIYSHFQNFHLPPGPLHPSPPQFISAILRLNVTLGHGSVEMHHGTVLGTLGYYEVAQKTDQNSPPPPKKNSPIVQFDPTLTQSPIQPQDGR